MNKTEMLADRLREIAREYKTAPRTLNQAADMIENQARNIELLQTALAIERQNHDRLQDWDRGMTAELAQVKTERDAAKSMIEDMAKRGKTWMCRYCGHAKSVNDGWADCELEFGKCKSPYTEFVPRREEAK